MRVQIALAVFLIDLGIVYAAELQEVASFPDKQLTGVGVSTRSGRVFVNFLTGRMITQSRSQRL